MNDFEVKPQFEIDRGGLTIVTGYSVECCGSLIAEDLTEMDARLLSESRWENGRTGKTPSQLAANLAAAQQETARLRAALEKLQPGIEAMGWMTDELRDMLK